MLNNWTYNDGNGNTKIIEKLDDFPLNTFGFIYKIVNINTGKYYIGKKSLIHNKRHKLTKKQLSEITGKGRRPKTEILKVENDWLLYNGSSKPLLKDIKELGGGVFQKKIIQICYSKKQLSYYEIFNQIMNDVLTDDNSYNDNISGKFFRKDLVVIL